ncbi:NADP-dependent oxidoreductase [Sphingobium sp. EM0848]|uniref:NADP-dependent oxidoreductase n=1 Tax=Sphingobium sp. EM0848 TaxID=2743473 RepID=UPI00159C4E70|nr:NADP-dependent oxidoreductase [Sphingobium sp. EM0848]
MTGGENRQIWLQSRPNGIPRASDFGLRTAPIPTLKEGQFLVRNAYLSVDPAMRGWIADKSTYWPRLEVGDTMRAYSVGEVIESRNPRYVPGEKVMGIFGWQDYAAVDEPAVYYKVQDNGLPLSLWLGVLGLNGLTGYFGMTEVCQPKPGETVVVSTAAGSVGSAAGQVARIKGARVVGITGGAEKVQQCLDEFGYDAVIDYKAEPDIDAALKAACPDGIDAYFDNTSGAIHDAVLRQINLHARIAICGTASFASWDPWPEGPRPERHLLVKRATMRGFLTPDFEDKYGRALTDLVTWIQEGKLNYREDMLEGMEAAPGSIETLYSGANSGKLVIRL